MIDIESGNKWLTVVLFALLVGSASGIGNAGWHETATGDPPSEPAEGIIEPPSGDPSSLSPADAGNRTSPVAINVTGPAIVARENETTYVWSTDPFDIVASVDSGSLTAKGEYSACLAIERNGTVEETRCRALSPTGSTSSAEVRPSVTFGFDRWPTNASGSHRFTVALDASNASTDGEDDRITATLYAVKPAGDLDGDQLSNGKERTYGTNLTGMDSDRDGLLDGAEVNEYGSDPLAADTDGDGLRDGTEIQRGTHPDRKDTDKDGVMDGDEVEKGMNPKSVDTDGDGLKDGNELLSRTDPLVRDSDHDGIIDGRERALGTDPLRADTDGDTLGDALEWRIGTDPTNPWIPVFPVAVVLVVLFVGIGMWTKRSVTAVLDRVLAGIGGILSDGAEADPLVTSEGPSSDAGDPTLKGPPMTDEERVLELLDREGGRVKQVRVVEMTDWSKAKVSRVLSRMEEAGEITRIKIGRENLVCHEDHVPKEVQSPFDD